MLHKKDKMSRNLFDLNNIWSFKKNKRNDCELDDKNPNEHNADLDERNNDFECINDEPNSKENDEKYDDERRSNYDIDDFCDESNDEEYGYYEFDNLDCSEEERNINDNEYVNESDLNAYGYYEFDYGQDSNSCETCCGDNEEECDKKKSKPRTKWIFLQDISISPELWNVVFKADTKSIDKNMFKQYKNLIAKHHIDPIVGCIALIRDFYTGCKIVYNGSEELTLWIYCQHSSCNRKYKITCSLHEAKNGLFQLFRSDDPQIHVKYLTRQVRQVERKQKQVKLRDMMPMEMRRQCIDNATDELLEQNNLQDVKSDAVYHKIRQEALQSIDLDKDDIKDMELMMNGDKAFIRKIIKKPFAVYIFSKAQCSVLFKLSNDSPDIERVGHLDATGGLIRHPFLNNDDIKQIYYYACIMNMKIGADLVGTLIPIFELVSECQESPFLAEWVFAFKTFFRANYPKLRTPFHRIVVDKSYALIHAVLEGFNDMSIIEYLLMSYDVVSKKLSVESTFFMKLVKIHLCYTHLSKVFSKNILKAFDLKKHTTETRFLKVVLQFLAKCKSYDQIKHAFYHLVTLFVNEFENKDVEESYKVLNELLKGRNEQNNDNFNKEMLENQEAVKENESDVESIQITDTIYGSSRFYHDFNDIIKERCKTFSLSPTVKQKLLKSKTLKNAFNINNMEFLQTFAKNYLSILPLWTGILITDSKVIVYHNQHVESNFRIAKECFKRKSIALGKLPTKCGRYLRQTIQRTERDIRGFKWDIGKFRLASNRPKPENRKRKNYQSDYVGLLEAKEKWMKKRPKLSKKKMNRKPVDVQSVTDACPFIVEATHFFQENQEIDVRPYFPEPISRESIDVTNKLENGLVDDFRYYKTVDKFNYVVAVSQKHRLMSEDFSLLSGTEWFSNTLIEYVVQLMLRKSKNIEASCIGADLLFLDPSKENAYKQFLKDYVLLPLWDTAHFVLVILDLKEKIISYIDPKGEQQEDFEKYTEKFKLFLIKYNLKFKTIGDISEWKVKKYEHSFQTDFVNCGSYVVRFCELFILKGEICYEEFDPYRYRRELQTMILSTCQTGMVDVCLCCGQHASKTPEGVDWIRCDVCERWLHAPHCANVNINDYPEGVSYKCPLCVSVVSVVSV